LKITQLSIKNFKSVEELVIRDIEDVLILVGRNNAGKSVMLDAIRAVSGDYAISEADFHHRDGNITIGIQLFLYLNTYFSPFRRYYNAGGIAN
jgi:putative ATP-dependent endonuclease of the OLD family